MMMKKKAERNPAMEGHEWEMRPCGMLVQKRNLDSSNHSNRNSCNFMGNSTIKIRVKFNSSLHQIQINPRSSFGELKKMLEGPTGVDPRSQKLTFKEKERDSKEFLDIVGVKDGSSLVLMEDFTKTAAMKSVAEVTMEVDKHARQARRLERVVAKGGIVVEKEVLSLTEMFMSLLIRLDGIVAHEDVKPQRKAQVIRVQRYIGMLDKLKAQNDEIQQGKKITFQKHQPEEEMMKARGQVCQNSPTLPPNKPL